MIYLIKANNREIIEIYVNKLVNRSNKMTDCSLFISCSVVFKNKTVENGKKQQKILSCKNDKNHSAYKNNSHQQKSTCSLHHDLVAEVCCNNRKT